MSKLQRVYNEVYTAEQLIDAAKKLGLSVPTTETEFEALASDIHNKKEYQVILEIENNFEAEDAKLTETERVIRAFADDLTGTRKMLQSKYRNEIVRSFCELVFNKTIEKLTENPFALNSIVFVHEKDFEHYNQIKCMIINEGSYTLSDRLTKLTSDLGIKKIDVSTSYDMLSVMISYE